MRQLSAVELAVIAVATGMIRLRRPSLGQKTKPKKKNGNGIAK